VTLLSVHVMMTWFMTGLIWFVQVVHYPLMGKIGPDTYEDYQVNHMRRTGWVVGPAMTAEAATGVWLLVHVGSDLLWFGFLLLVVIWGSTAFIQVPRHNQLIGGFDAGCHRILVWTNWIRTAAWTARSALGFAMLGMV
jgi:uncharacterized membrane protein